MVNLLSGLFYMFPENFMFRDMHWQSALLYRLKAPKCIGRMHCFTVFLKLWWSCHLIWKAGHWNFQCCLTTQSSSRGTVLQWPLNKLTDRSGKISKSTSYTISEIASVLAPSSPTVNLCDRISYSGGTKLLCCESVNLVWQNLEWMRITMLMTPFLQLCLSNQT
jgi:hypothetical protein